MPSRRKRKRARHASAKAQIRYIYETGRTCAEIATILAIDETTVRRWLKDSGAQLRRRGPRGGVHREAQAVVRSASRTAADRAQALVDHGASVTDAARAVGLARQTLYRYGVRCRRRSKT